MKRMLRLSWLLVLLISVANAQSVNTPYSTTGTVRDSVSARPVAYATISLFDASQQLVASVYSQESGLFKAPVPRPGTYRVEISFVGYRTHSFRIEILSDSLHTRLGNILLAPGNDVLQEVRVTALKRLVDQKPGMLIYNAENDLSNKGGTAADVLRKAPVLNVDAQGNVSMRGSSNLKILVNGKYSGQMARSAADALNMMPADMIKSIEIITTPSAKYDAEGAAGVINIITKKGRSAFSGTLEGSVSNLEQMLNPRLSIAQGKWNINLAGHLHRLRRKTATFVDRTNYDNNAITNKLLQETEKDNAAPHGSADLTVDFSPNEKTAFSFGMNTWFGKWPDGSGMRSTVLAADGSIAEQYRQNITSSNEYLGADIYLGYSRKFRRTGQQLTILVQRTPGRDISQYDALQRDNDDALLYREMNYSKTKNREWTFQADYVHPLNSKGTSHIEAGGKMVLRSVGNAYEVRASETTPVDQLVLQPDRSDDFRYSQDVFAGYAMVKFNLKNNWYVEAGSRVEATSIDGKFLVSKTAFDNHFLNLVPTATLTKKLDERNTLTLSYTKRLTRPYIWDLNPNVDASDPKNLESGNPALEPEIAHQAELAYGFNSGRSFFVNAALYGKQTDNAIVEIMETDANGISLTRKQNLAATKQLGINLSATTQFTSRWTLNGNANINYYDYSSSALDIARMGFATEVNLNTTYKFPHDLAVQAFGEYNTKQVTLLGNLGKRWYYSFACKKEIKKARMGITLSAVNLFSTYITQTDTRERVSFVSQVNNRYYNRAVKLTVNWEFGGKPQQKKHKKVENNDINVQGKG